MTDALSAPKTRSAQYSGILDPWANSRVRAHASIENHEASPGEHSMPGCPEIDQKIESARGSKSRCGQLHSPTLKTFHAAEREQRSKSYVNPFSGSCSLHPCRVVVLWLKRLNPRKQ
eukprot:5767084-Amphidinium_carterae.1